MRSLWWKSPKAHQPSVCTSWTNANILDLYVLGIRSKSMESVESNPKKAILNILFKNILLIWGFPFKIQSKRHKENAFRSQQYLLLLCRLDETAVFVQSSKIILISDFLSLNEKLEKSDDSMMMRLSTDYHRHNKNIVLFFFLYSNHMCVCVCVCLCVELFLFVICFSL